MSQSPPSQPPMHASGMAPHHGTAVLVMGILSLVPVLCGLGWILGLIAWIMGNGDLREMDAGRMDPSGRGSVHAGKVCGMISVILHAVTILVYVMLVALGVAGGILGAASGHR